MTTITETSDVGPFDVEFGETVTESLASYQAAFDQDGDGLTYTFARLQPEVLQSRLTMPPPAISPISHQILLVRQFHFLCRG